jgi:folate-binding protein YgfZ
VTPKANPPTSLASLSGYSILGAEGPDAGAFLHAQAMNDVRALAPGQWQWNGWLNAKGRVIALFALLRTAPDAYFLVLPDYPAAELQPKLQRFVFRSKLRLQAHDDWRCAAEMDGAAADSTTRDLADGDTQSGWRLDMGGDGGARFLHLLPPGGEAGVAHDPGVESTWRDADLAHGLPRLDGDAIEAWTPQMLSLDRLRAFSLKKGCYPGQEIVARTHYLGKARRGLARLSGVALARGAVVETGDGQDIGRVVCISDDGGQALAVVQVDHASEAMRTSAGPIALLPLLQGLQRPV